MTRAHPDSLPQLPQEVVQALFDAVHRVSTPNDTDLQALVDRFPRHEGALRAHWDFVTGLRAQRQGTPANESAAGVGALPERVGPYRILSILGAGGMGTVYLAEQEEPVARRVALKVIKLGMDTRTVLARFAAERQALALMDHTSIAKVFDAGITTEGRPYFVMEYVQGVPITRYCDDHCLSIDERLAVFRQVCSGVQHAHHKGVIHRDLTPNNVLVTVQDGRPLAKIIDFGLARAVDHRATQRTLFTERGVILGTPEYMSPEQAGLDALDIDVRTDVYTLGVLLYELLTGSLPFASATLRAAGYDRMCAIIQAQEPEKPSAKVTKHARGSEQLAQLRGTAADRLLRRLRGDLDWVVMKCLEKDRNRRYATVSELAADVQRHLDNEPVVARAPSMSYRLVKFVRRYRLPLAVAVTVAFALFSALAVSVHFWLDADAQAREARRQEGIASQKTQEATANATVALARKREFDQLASVVQLRRLLETRARLHPPWPEQLDALRSWTADARSLLATRPAIEATVAALRERRETTSSSAAAGVAAGDQRQEAADDAGAAAGSERFLLETLEQLLTDLAELVTELPEIEKRSSWAEKIAAMTERHPNAGATWAEARAAIARADGVVASFWYGEHPIDLKPQMGLVPIGMNPATRLWEFYELRSAWDGVSDPATIPVPRHVDDGDRHGHIPVGDSTGIVFVLVPGGTFTFGAQNQAPRAANYDPQALPFHVTQVVTLSPFFLARHELTQGQWRRLTGEVPSNYGAGKTISGQLITWANPVERVDWHACDRCLSRHGLMLPTEVQWEYAGRAGASTPWWTGADRQTLVGAANLADQTAKDGGAFWEAIDDWPELRDGFVVHAPVDALRANAFGLHHVHGNVFEWCADWFGPSTVPVREGDGLRLVEEGKSSFRTWRGGSCFDTAAKARFGDRNGNDPSSRLREAGLRAARRLDR